MSKCSVLPPSTLLQGVAVKKETIIIDGDQSLHLERVFSKCGTCVMTVSF